jgi:hypothetical protein
MLIAALWLTACQSTSQDQQNTVPDKPHQITTACADPRPEFCTRDYRPVCAQADTGVRCVKAPCPEAREWKTFGNACTACSDETVMGYKEGECEAVE